MIPFLEFFDRTFSFLPLITYFILIDLTRNVHFVIHSDLAIGQPERVKSRAFPFAIGSLDPSVDQNHGCRVFRWSHLPVFFGGASLVVRIIKFAMHRRQTSVKLLTID